MGNLSLLIPAANKQWLLSALAADLGKEQSLKFQGDYRELFPAFFLRHYSAAGEWFEAISGISNPCFPV
jgi:hypothetical protein